MGIAEGSCTIHVPRKAVFEKPNQPGSKARYIKYGIFTIGGHDWEIQAYPDGAGTVTLHLCLLSSTTAEVERCEIWTNPDYSASELDYANNVHVPNVPKEIDSVTVSPPPKGEDSVFIKVVLSVVEAAAPVKPGNQWDSHGADVSFDGSTNKPVFKPGSAGAGSGQWNLSNTDVSFDGSAKPSKPSGGPGSAWNTSNADISFDSAKSS